MNDPMLGAADRSKAQVARNLGCDVVEFRKGFLEEVSVEDATAVSLRFRDAVQQQRALSA